MVASTAPATPPVSKLKVADGRRFGSSAVMRFLRNGKTILCSWLIY
jgi:hypothetical protein